MFHSLQNIFISGQPQVNSYSQTMLTQLFILFFFLKRKGMIKSAFKNNGWKPFADVWSRDVMFILNYTQQFFC